MCGIAGQIDLRGQRRADPAVLARMAAALDHRGPDADGFFLAPGVGLASRRLSIVGVSNGSQPMFNEDRSVVVVFNGELFDYQHQRAELASRGHEFRTDCDTELLVHLWEEQGEQMLTRLRGQFAFALYDRRQRVLILARDRVGICPLHWSQQGDWLYFSSEIKGLLASGQVPAEADARGLDHIFTFFAMPSRRTAFKDISAVAPGGYLRIEFQPGRAAVDERTYWDFNFPDRGEEENPQDPAALIDRFGEAFFRAVDRRLQADVPVVGYLSGGIDSTAVLAAAAHLRQEPMHSFTVRIPTPGLDESKLALRSARLLGSTPTVVNCSSAELAEAYPRVIRAADSPVVDTSCAALWCLSQEVHNQGYRVALTGEGSDEALAGYPWFKVHKLFRLFDRGSFRPSLLARGAVRRVVGCGAGLDERRRIEHCIGGPHAQSLLYYLVSTARERFYSDAMFERLDGHVAYEDLDLDLARMRRWHPLNQSLYFGYKTILPGLLLNHKGDRVAMANSVETRYPFLDEDLIDLCAAVHPRWKLRGIRGDKHLLRRFASRLLPGDIVRRPKAMFRAPLAPTFFSTLPRYVEQLLSDESLRQTPYFDPLKVQAQLRAYRSGRSLPGRRTFIEMGLVSVVATQLWHHQYLGGGLCELPDWSAEPSPRPLLAVS